MKDAERRQHGRDALMDGLKSFLWRDGTPEEAHRIIDTWAPSLLADIRASNALLAAEIREDEDCERDVTFLHE